MLPPLNPHFSQESTAMSDMPSSAALHSVGHLRNTDSMSLVPSVVHVKHLHLKHEHLCHFVTIPVRNPG